MIDTNQINQVAQEAAAVQTQMTMWWPTICLAGAWAVREIHTVDNWLFEKCEYFMAHGGLGRWLIAVFWAPAGPLYGFSPRPSSGFQPPSPAPASEGQAPTTPQGKDGQ